MVILMTLMVSVSMFGQKDSVSVSVSGDVAYYTKNLSTFTGLMFGEEPAVVSHLNVNAHLKDFNFSAAYTGQNSIHHVTDGDRFHMFDLSAGYKVNNEISACVGYELTYSDAEDDEFGQGVFAIATWSTKGSVATFILFADPKIQNRYYIGSFEQKVGNVSLYVLGAYTNTKTIPWYGLVGLKYSKDNLFVGTYYMLDKDNPGPVISLGLTF